MRLLLSLMVTALFLAACNDDVGPNGRLIGGPCVSSANCDALCVMNDRFPGGYCTQPCTNDAQCPAGTVCIKAENGMCAVLCTTVGDCSDFGRGYTCAGAELFSGGTAAICRVP